MANFSQTWEDLRRRARKLENDIDSKLVTFSKLGISVGGNSFARFDVAYSTSSTSEKAPLITSQSSFDGLSAELQSLLTKLTEVNDQMNDFVQSAVASGWSQNPALSHTLRRHHEILRDYNNELNRTRNNIQTQLDRQQLLTATDANAMAQNNGLNNRVKTELYLKENEHINRCDRMLDEQISIAMSTKEHMQTQRFNIRDISKKLNTITKRYPAVNSLMQKIQLKKRKDTIVLAGVIATCLILMFIYVMHS